MLCLLVDPPSPSSSPSVRYTHLTSSSYDWKRFLEGLKGRAEFKDGKEALNLIAVGVRPCLYE